MSRSRQIELENAIGQANVILDSLRNSYAPSSAIEEAIRQWELRKSEFEQELQQEVSANVTVR